MFNTYRQIQTTFSQINYHFAFCPRYRKKIFLQENVEKRFEFLTNEICRELDIDVVTLECNQDYTYMVLNAPPTLSPAEIMAKIKGKTSRILREEFSHLNHLPSLWTRSYFVSTSESVSSEMIKRYVELQKTRG
ncbi:MULTISPECIES: IS200/IS605 family transposase [Planococcus]|uniref:IS200/IS605 family transposase n=1 Tax=Planococcus maitriensis TaxID=221799 RepID=A0A365K9Y6_9BACL|nr:MULTISPECIES: IS200/IS605 family transposase [Planococcus]RAZ69171.1 IS200/IS605 family transposase [Planococcus maitriensis]